MNTAPATPEAVESAWRAAQQWLSDYADAVDTADLTSLGRLCEGVTVHAPTGAQASGADVAVIYAPLVLTPDPDGRRRTKHHVTNVSVRSDDAGRARARAYYLLVKEVDGRPAIAASGRYETLLAPSEQGWRVTDHRVVRDLIQA